MGGEEIAHSTIRYLDNLRARAGFEPVPDVLVNRTFTLVYWIGCQPADIDYRGEDEYDYCVALSFTHCVVFLRADSAFIRFVQGGYTLEKTCYGQAGAVGEWLAQLSQC
jgi:hypothetical protein